MDEYEKWEKDCKKIKKHNNKLLEDFEEWLQKTGIKSKTINKHYSNVELYINNFLLYEDATQAKDGIGDIGMFLGYWFIKKAMWASVSAIKENASSLKKFYQFMLEKEEISNEDYEDLKETIKSNMPEWLATIERYDNPDIEDMGEVWGL